MPFLRSRRRECLCQRPTASAEIQALRRGCRAVQSTPRRRSLVSGFENQTAPWWKLEVPPLGARASRPHVVAVLVIIHAGETSALPGGTTNITSFLPAR